MAQAAELPQPVMTAEEKAAVADMRHALEQQRQAGTFQHVSKGDERPLDRTTYEMVPQDDGTLLRFLIARKLDVVAATEMYVKYALWFCENDVGHILEKPEPCAEVLQYAVSHQFHRFDRHGRPMYIQRCGKLHVNEFLAFMTPDRLTQRTVWSMEKQLSRMRESSLRLGQRVDKLVIVLDMAGVSLHHRHMDSAFKISNVIEQNYYPECLGRMYMINCPFFFPVLFNIAKGFLDKRTVEKIRVLGTDYKEVLVEELGAACLPEEYGGTCQCAGGCLTRYYTQAELQELKFAVPQQVGNEAEVIEITVKNGDKYEVDFQVEPNDNLHYYFRTVDKDIGFFVTFIPNNNNNNNQADRRTSTIGMMVRRSSVGAVELVKNTRVEAHKIAFKGSVVSPGHGTVRFTWDNTYSFWTSKTLHYVIHTEKNAIPADDSEAPSS